jgi:putative hydrolase of the HAD superfamily
MDAPQEPALLVDRIRELSRPQEPLPTDEEARPGPLPGLRAVLFDIYGTLFISGSGDVGTATARDSAAAAAEAFACCGFGGDLAAAAARVEALMPETIRRHHARAVERGVRNPEIEIRAVWPEILAQLQSAAGLTAAADRAAVERLAVEYECRVNPVWGMPGTAEALAALRAQGLRLGIVSNAQFYTPLSFRALFGESVEQAGFEPDLVSWSFCVGEAKPSEAIFAGPLERLAAAGIRPAEVAYLGNDMLNDVWTARAVGCRTILFAGDRRSLRRREDDDRCRDLRPDAVLTDLAQLPAAVGA